MKYVAQLILILSAVMARKHRKTRRRTRDSYSDKEICQYLSKIYSEDSHGKELQGNYFIS